MSGMQPEAQNVWPQSVFTEQELRDSVYGRAFGIAATATSGSIQLPLHLISSVPGVTEAATQAALDAHTQHNTTYEVVPVRVADSDYELIEQACDVLDQASAAMGPYVTDQALEIARAERIAAAAASQPSRRNILGSRAGRAILASAACIAFMHGATTVATRTMEASSSAAIDWAFYGVTATKDTIACVQASRTGVVDAETVDATMRCIQELPGPELPRLLR